MEVDDGFCVTAEIAVSGEGRRRRLERRRIYRESRCRSGGSGGVGVDRFTGLDAWSVRKGVAVGGSLSMRIVSAA